jgi:hypothetical protein
VCVAGVMEEVVQEQKDLERFRLSECGNELQILLQDKCLYPFIYQRGHPTA